MEAERIQKVLARAGVGSRRAVEEMIVDGRISVNGERAVLGGRIDPAKDQVLLDGSPIPLATDLVHFLLNKPVGVVSTTSDPEGRPTVVELVETEHRVWPVGRLDVETEGALILTNDGDLALRLTHPRYGIAKTYLAEVRGDMGTRALKLLRRGVELEDGVTAPAETIVVEKGGGKTLLQLTLREGRNRQVRRMCEAVGHPVERLVRTGLGPLTLGRLKPGRSRRLAPLEVRSLYEAAGDE